MLYFETLCFLRATFENLTSFASRDLHAADLTLGPAKHHISHPGGQLFKGGLALIQV
jgi:hypothetical protein